MRICVTAWGRPPRQRYEAEFRAELMTQRMLELYRQEVASVRGHAGQ